MTSQDTRPYYLVAAQDPRLAMSRFQDALDSMNVHGCLFPFETVRVKVFRKLGLIDHFRPALERWKSLLLEAIESPAYAVSLKHHRLLFAMALHLNDRVLAERVSSVYLRGFDLDEAFPRPTPIVCPAVRPPIDVAAEPRNRIDGRVRVLIHVDGDSAFLPSYLPGISCGEAILELFSRYGFPATVSLVCQDVILDRIEHGGRNGVRIREAFRPGLTRLASHGFIHPFSWRTEPFDAEREIAGAKHFLERWSGERIDVFLYTGDCHPTSGQLWQVDCAELLGVNGQARFERPMLRVTDDWFQFLAAGASDGAEKDYSTYCIRNFERVLAGEADYPLSVYVHHYVMMTQERASGLVRVLDWLRANADRLHFDSLENYYGEWRGRIVPSA